MEGHRECSMAENGHDFAHVAACTGKGNLGILAQSMH
jgi:hypothetical protein